MGCSSQPDQSRASSPSILHAALTKNEEKRETEKERVKGVVYVFLI
jgi:hypothetical protein